MKTRMSKIAWKMNGKCPHHGASSEALQPLRCGKADAFCGIQAMALMIGPGILQHKSARICSHK